MKHLLTFVLLLCLSIFTAVVIAEDEGCPAQSAGQKGFTPIADFHHAIAPAWHEYYPNKDLDALSASAHEFAEKIKPIMKLEPEFKTVERKEGFESHRAKLADLVEKALGAAEEDDGQAVYDILPDLHDNFEYMASYLLPLDYPQLSSLQQVLDIMVGTHLENDDIEAVKTSMTALELKCGDLRESKLPPDLKSVEKEAAADLAEIQASFAELKEMCEGKDETKIRECLLKLTQKVKEFEKNYI
jgi:hypothetical protein